MAFFFLFDEFLPSTCVYLKLVNLGHLQIIVPYVLYTKLWEMFYGNNFHFVKLQWFILMNVSWSIYIRLKLAILGNVQTICYSHIVRVYFENISYFYQIHLCRCSHRNSYPRRVLEILIKSISNLIQNINGNFLQSIFINFLASFPNRCVSHGH